MYKKQEVVNVLKKKYGEYITNKLVVDGKVFLDNINKDGREEQKEVMKHIKSLLDENGEKLVPENFFEKNDLEWGMDFSSWLGNLNEKKKFMFIGAEPHLSKNYQLVYDFGSHKDKTIEESALCHYNRDNGRDIWNYLTKIFVVDLEDEKKITEFLNQCYITDLCHLVPKGCGQVKKIKDELGIQTREWNKFRTKIAQKFLPDEINAVKPEFIILHGNAARNHFRKKNDLNFKEHKIENSPYKILEGEYNGYKMISIPHLKGDMRNKLWRCKKHEERPEEAQRILRELTNIKKEYA